MPSVLHLEASPNGDRSTSSAMARAFLDAYAEKHPDDRVETLSVWSADLPAFGPEHARAKFGPLLGEPLTPGQEAAWATVKATIQAFDAADKLVISCPMWNFSIPHALKNYLDVIVQPGLSFSAVVEAGVVEHFGLLRDRPTQLLLTRSSTPEGDAHDFQLPYLRHILAFIGIEDVRVLVAGQTTKPPGKREAYVEKQCALARSAAKRF